MYVGELFAMKLAAARLLFGASCALAGVLTLMWHLEVFRHLPFGIVIGGILAVAQVAGGIGMLFAGSARFASMMLAVVFLMTSLSCVPGIISHPAIYQSYGSFFEQFCLLSGAVAMYAPQGARVGLGLSALSFALEQVFYLHETAALVPAWIPPAQMFWAIVTTIAFALAALAALTNIQARRALRLMTLMLVLFGVLIWIPAVVSHPGVHGNWTEFTLNFQIAGATLLVAECAVPIRARSLAVGGVAR
jgi:hypothetical protein